MGTFRGSIPRSKPSRAMGKHSERVTCKARISITTCATPASVTPDFISAASGEWEGHKVYFDADGTAEPIPEKFMPPAFKEWGQVLVDWQSQCAMNVTTDGGLYARELRFIPTAGCEADSSTVETQWDRNVDLTNIRPASTAFTSTTRRRKRTRRGKGAE